MTLSVTHTFTSGTAAVASQVNTNFSDIVAYVNGTGGNVGVLLTSGGTLTGSLTVGANGAPQTSTLFGAVTVGQASAGYDVTFHGASGTSMVWNNTNKDLTITGTSGEDALIVADGRTRLDDRVYCEGSDDITLSGISGALIVGGDGSGVHVAIDGNEIMAKTNATTAGTLHINNDGGTVKFGNETDLTAFEVKGPATFHDGITGTLTGNASTATTATSATTAGTVTTAAQSNITSLGTLTALTLGGHATVSANDTYNLFAENMAPTKTWSKFFQAQGNYIADDPSTGTGNDAEWVVAYGVYVLNRNSSLQAEKENISTDLGSHLTASMIDDVPVKMFNRIHSPNCPEIGFIAEDMDSISPFLGANGTDVNGDKILTGVNKTGVISLLVLALQDARARITALEG